MYENLLDDLHFQKDKEKIIPFTSEEINDNIIKGVIEGNWNSQRREKRKRSLHRKTNSQIFNREDLRLIEGKCKPINKVQSEINHNYYIDLQKESIKDKNDNYAKEIGDISEDLNNSLIIIENSPEKEKEKENCSSYKSFIPIVNTLKYSMEKEESATESYLLALGLDKENKNKNYAVGSIIEEEKSDMLISESEISSKKKIINKFNQNKENISDFNNIQLNLSTKLNQEFTHCDGQKKKNIYECKKLNNQTNKMSLTIKELIKRKEEKEKNKRNQVTLNKKCLLSTFYTLENKNELLTKGEKDNLIQKCLNKEQKPKLRRANSQTNSNHNISIKHSRSSSRKVPLNQKKNSQYTMIKHNSKPSLNKIPIYISHIKNHILEINNIPFNNSRKKKEKNDNIKDANFNKALKLINSNRSNNSKLHNSHNNTNNSSNITRTGTRSNSQSSKSREKPAIFKKTKSQYTFRNFIPLCNDILQKNSIVNNRNEIKETLKHRLLYTKVYEKKDVIDKITMSNDNFYLIMCEKRQVGKEGNNSYVS